MGNFVRGTLGEKVTHNSCREHRSCRQYIIDLSNTELVEFIDRTVDYLEEATLSEEEVLTFIDSAIELPDNYFVYLCMEVNYRVPKFVEKTQKWFESFIDRELTFMNGEKAKVGYASPFKR